MNRELLKHLLNLKISLVRKVLYDVSKEYVKKGPSRETTKHSGGVKVIDVE